MITSLVMAGSALASVIVPLTAKVMSVAVPAAAELVASVAARSEPVPESLRVDTVSDCVVSGRKPSCPRTAEALAAAAGAAAVITDAHTAGAAAVITDAHTAGAAAVITDAHTAITAAPAIRHRTPLGRNGPTGGLERENRLPVVGTDIVCCFLLDGTGI